MNNKVNHLVLISIDALNAQDFKRLIELPTFSEIIKNGSYAREVVGIYPSLTYPSHTSIITGTYPDKHGLFTNEMMQPGVRRQQWYWHKKHIKVPTLCDIAKEANMKIGNIFFPVMAGAEIDYNCPEIWTTKPKESQVLKSLRTGSPLFLLNIMRKFGKILNGIEEPELDNFVTESAAYMIKSKKPNLSLMHLNEVDHIRHKYGFNAPELDDAFKRMDERVNKIINAVKEAGIYENTAFVILGDHGFADVDYKICMNAAFVKKGLISLDENGDIKDWKVYSNYCDGSVQIKIKADKDEDTFNKVKEMLYDMKKSKEFGIKKVYTKSEVEQKKVTGDFDFMLEAEDGYYFDNDWKTEEVVSKVEKSNSRANDPDYFAATHGYDPLKENYRTFFMVSGPGIKKGFSVPEINLVDEGPTMAKILGLKMNNVDGRIIEEIFE
ncbi:alkaline phosphatase family protein [Clostridium hydrogenum]|uniref:alkaline phosphatase family protein n=1 Tax=Clostridium hydrogenum TaxID=2855764 RepID=UPI001F36773C|nr:alkaline phosphatase family protein [Clostridium hydrogenum]